MKIKILILISILIISLQNCGKIDFMDDKEGISSQTKFSAFNMNFNEVDSTIYLHAKFNTGMGQYISKCGFCWGIGNIIPALNKQDCRTIVSRENVAYGIDINGDGMPDFPGSTSSIYTDTDTLGYASSIKCTNDGIYAIRPFILLNNVNIIYGPLFTIEILL
ncbi:MAG: hypothetical protein NT092_13310 [Bacteroidia bacterium]|nr:hypothetical protein [Bacteroidia bacterium]